LSSPNARRLAGNYAAARRERAEIRANKRDVARDYRDVRHDNRDIYRDQHAWGWGLIFTVKQKRGQLWLPLFFCRLRPEAPSPQQTA
jgi:hypothetical protein